ncbi:molybdenum cofactor biosynthesis protein MoaE [Bacteriovoracaceae bacterium]|nr:molybdenum cofactor biosynthesis protein MoaE [Bacteriovoracaceae bacterium]
MFLLTEEILVPDTLIAKIKNPAAGALVTFEGWVRNENDGKSVTGLEYEVFFELCEKEMDVIISETKERFAILDLSIAHRYGEMNIGDLAVWIGVVSKHRAPAYDASKYLIDELKFRLPIWKKEFYVDGLSTWVNCKGCRNHNKAPIDDPPSLH